MIDILAISHASFTAVNREVYARLLGLGYNIELVVPEELQYSSGVKKAEPKRDKDPKIHFLKISTMNPRIQLFLGLEEILNHRKPKIVFLDNDPGSLIAGKIAKWSKNQNASLVCQSCENLSFSIPASYKRLGFKGVLLSIFKNFLVYRSKRNISHLFTISNDGLELFKKLNFKSVSKIPLGFDDAIFNKNTSSRDVIRNKLALDGTVIAYFGRIVFEKGIHVLLEALKSMKDKSWTLIMDEFELYTTPYAEDIKRLIKEYELSDRVQFINANHIEIADYMNASDVVVLPSVTTPKWKEQYGRVIPEAMACGNAVVVSDSGTLPELVENTGIIVPENNAELLKKKLVYLLDNPKALKNYKNLAFNRAHEKLNVHAQLTEYEKVFKPLL